MKKKVNTFCIHGIDGLQKQCPKCLQSAIKLFGKDIVNSFKWYKWKQ